MHILFPLPFPQHPDRHPAAAGLDPDRLHPDGPVRHRRRNIMSLTGIAISIGVLVDAGIVMTENVIRHCERAEEELKRRRLTPAGGLCPDAEAATQVGRPMVFSMLIIILAFVPVFLLTGQEGKLFHPLAYTKTFALLGATLLAVTAVPVFCTLLVRGPLQPEDQNWLMKGLLRLYDPALTGPWTTARPCSGSRPACSPSAW
jgi:Cu(I)/Ag(I) efflux system membrane protein CusA/SilA